LQVIHQALGTTSRCVIAKARPRPVADNLIKSGVHIHWPDLIVTRTQALNFRSKIVLSLTSDFPFDWDKIIDVSVYGGSGLRMLWSHKKPTGDPYIPWKSLDGAIEFSKIPNAETLELFAVRTEDTEVDREELTDTSQLQDFIQKYLDGQSRSIVKKVQRHEHDGWYVQTDSKFCERIHKEHKSNHVWFHIAGRRISQRCFDEECNEFRGQEHILPPSIVEQLKDVAIVGSPSTCFLVDIFPNGTPGQVQKVRAHGSSLLGSGSNELGEIPREPPRVRTVGFNPVG